MRRLPMEGVKVADFSWVLAGPSVGRMLADFGATVVRVESAKRVDLARSLSPFTNGEARPDNSALASDVNAGKLGLALDLAHPAAQDVARKLTDWADIAVESFSPGTMEKWGLNYANLVKTNPDLIMLSTCLLGNTGPFSRMAGFGSAGACMSGIHYVTGWPDLFPTGFSGPYTDFVAPRFSLIGILAALDRRRRTGEGAYIDLSQTEAGLQFVALELADYFRNGRVAARCGNDDVRLAPNNVYVCRNAPDGSSRFVAITVRSQPEWTVLYNVLGLQGIDDLGAADTDERLRQRRRIDDAIAAATRDAKAEDVEAMLQSAGVPAYTVLTSIDLPHDAQLQARNHFIKVSHPRRGSTYVESTRILLSETPGAPRGAGPDVGEHDDYVLRELLGLTEPEISDLRETGALN